MKNSHVLNHSSYIPDILEYDCDFHQKKTYTAAKCLKIQNQNSESAFYISCTTQLLDQHLLDCVIFKGTCQWSKKVKLYILQFKLNTVINSSFIKITENIFSKYLENSLFSQDFTEDAIY